MMFKSILFPVFVTATLLASVNTYAAQATVAVAANFAEVAQHLKTDFEKQTGDQVSISVGSTGALYAQIQHGAPFDIMLSADQRRPRLLEQEGNAVPGSRFTYAIGQLTLWSPKAGVVAKDGATTLAKGDFQRLAIANPKLAPYGAAAVQTLRSLHLYDKVAPRIVTGANIGQTFAMVYTKNAELGLVALSYVLSSRNTQPGSRWDVPQKLYTPIRQDAILTMHGKDNPAARKFLAFIRKPAALAVIRSFGYRVMPPKK